MPSAIDQTLASFEHQHREERLRAILASGLVTSLKPAAARAKLASLALRATSDNVSRASLDLLGQLLDGGKWPALSPISYDKALVDPAVLEFVLARGISLAIPKNDASRYRYWLVAWGTREDENLVEDELALVGAHPWLGAVLVATMLPGADRKRLGPILDRASRLASSSSATASGATASGATASGATALGATASGATASGATASGAMGANGANAKSANAKSANAKSANAKGANAKGAKDAKPTGGARVFAGIDARVAELAAFGTLDVFVPPKDSSDGAPTELWLHAIARPSVLARCPRVEGALRELTPARLLRNSLHAQKLLPKATDDDARALVELATAPVREPDTVMDYGNMQAVLVAKAPAAVEASPALVAAIAALVGGTRSKGKKASAPHARIAELAGAAASIAPAFERLQGRLVLATASTGASTTSVRMTDAGNLGPSPVSAHDEDFPSVAHLLDHQMPWWTLDLGTEMPEQMHDAGRYLFASDTQKLPSTIATPTFATPSPTAFPWELLITRVGELMYRVLAPATSKARRAEFVEMLELWLASGFPAHTKKLRGADFMVPEAMVNGMDRRFTTRLVSWGPNRYFVRYFRPIGGGRAGVRVLEHAHDGVFRVPDGVQMGEHLAADARFDDRAIRTTLELLEKRGPVPFDASVSGGIAQRTGLSTAAATLVWTAGYEPWLAGEKKRAEMGLERDALDEAERELAKPRLREIYVTAMPADPAQMYEPAVLAERVADAWRVYRAEVQAWEARRAAEEAREQAEPTSESEAN